MELSKGCSAIKLIISHQIGTAKKQTSTKFGELTSILSCRKKYLTYPHGKRIRI